MRGNEAWQRALAAGTAFLGCALLAPGAPFAQERAPAERAAAEPAAADPGPRGTLVLLDGGAPQVLFVDAATGATRGTAPTGLGPRAVAAQGGRLYVANRGTERTPGSSVTVIDAAARRAERTLPVCDGCGPAALAFDEGGTLWIAAQADPALLALAPPYGRPRVTRLDDAPASVAAAGDPVAAGLAGRDVAVLAPAAATTRRLGVAVAPALLVRRPGTAEVWTAAGAEPALVAIDLSRDGSAARVSHRAPAFVQDLAFLPDGSGVLVAGGRDRMVVLLETSGGRERARIAFASAPRRISVSPDGRFAAVLLPEEGRVALVALGAGALRPAGGFEVEIDVAGWTWLE